MKEYLVVLAGSPRGGEETWSSLYKYVVNYLDADLAICTGDKWLSKQSFLGIAKYQWIFKEPKNWENYYENNFSGSWKEYFLKGENTGLFSSGLIHFALKDIILKKHLDVLKKYKYIIYTRFDQKYTDYHPQGRENEILIPKGEDYFGICDRHALFSSKYSEDFLSICEFVNSKESLKMIKGFNNCETTFLNHLNKTGLIHKVKRLDRSQFTTSLKGEHTNWRVAKYKLYFFKDLMIKYPDEFLVSISNLIKSKGIFYVVFNEFRMLLNFQYLKTREILGNMKNRYAK